MVTIKRVFVFYDKNLIGRANCPQIDSLPDVERLKKTYADDVLLKIINKAIVCHERNKVRTNWLKSWVGR
jgi:hypothetical protein